MTSPRLEPSTDEDEMKNQCIAKLRDQVVEKIVRENRTTSFVADHRLDQLTRIAEQRILKMITDFHTPDHPTYAFMIRRAITELNNEGRSDRESISEFIRTEYDDLPLAHESLLRFQLNKFCEKGDILLSAMGCYLFPVGDYVQEKLVVKESRERQVQKKAVEGSNVEGNEADVCSREMKGKKQNGKGGLRPGSRWSRRLQPGKSHEDEINKVCNEFVEDLAQTEGQNDATRNQKCHIELPDHGIFDEPLEPPGFPIKKDQLIKLKQQAQALEAFQMGVEVNLKQAEKEEMKSEILQLCDGCNISDLGDHAIFQLSCGELLQPVTGPNIISKDAKKLELHAPDTAISYDSLRQNHADSELPELKNVDPELPELNDTETADGVLLPNEKGKPEAEHRDMILNQTTAMELSQLRKEEEAGLIQFQGRGPCTDDAPDHSVLTTIPSMAQDQLTISTEVVTMLANPIPDACSTALVTWPPDDDQHLEKPETPMRRGQGRPRKLTPNGLPIITEKPKKKDGRGRPRKQKPDELPESRAEVEAENLSKSADASREWEEAGTRLLAQYSNSDNDSTLTTESASQDKEGINKRKRIGRPPKIDKDELSESMDFPKAKKGQGKERKAVFYTDISITDLIYSQDHHLQVQPISRFRGRPRKL